MNGLYSRAAYDGARTVIIIAFVRPSEVTAINQVGIPFSAIMTFAWSTMQMYLRLRRSRLNGGITRTTQVRQIIQTKADKL